MSDQAPLPPRSDPADSFTMQVLAAIYYHKEAAWALLARGVGPDFFKHEDCRTVAQWVLLGKKEPPPDDVAVALQRDSATTKSIAESLMMYRQSCPEDAVSDVERHTADYIRARADGEWHGFVPGQNAIRAPIEKDPARIAWTPVPVTDLGPSAPPDWLWPGYIARGHITLFWGVWKGGKTTLVANLLRDMERGGGLVGDAVKGVKVLVVTEETKSTWCRRRDAMRFSTNIHTLILPFKGRPDNATWLDFIDHICGLIRKHGYQLVVFDTVASFWPVQNENDASELMSALIPLRQISNLDCALLLVHHPRKSGGDEGQGSRGSGSFTGFADVLVELRRFNKADLKDTRRLLITLSRLDDCPGEEVWDWQDGTYVKVGDQSAAFKMDRMEAIGRLLPNVQPGLTPEEVHAAWSEERPVGQRTLELDLQAGLTQGRWSRTGSGKKNDAYRYYSPSRFDSRKPPCLGARIESKPANPPAEPGKEVA